MKRSKKKNQRNRGVARIPKSGKRKVPKPRSPGAPEPDAIEKILRFEEGDPFKFLGPHPITKERGVIIRAFFPRAIKAWVVPSEGDQERKPMERLRPEGFFQAVFENAGEIFPYTIVTSDEAGFQKEAADPYAFFPDQLSDYDLYLLGQGTHYRSYEKFGSQLLTLKGIRGVFFMVWAPNAKSVGVVGNFNHWTQGAHPMTRFPFSGVWGLFIPGLDEGEVYKYAIRSSVDGQVRFKTDPYAFGTELRPGSAAVVTRLDRYSWNDQTWMEERKRKDLFKSPVSIYEVHLGSWKRDEKNGWGFLNYRELAHQLVEYVRFMGYTHIELMPVMEHPLDESWGYQVISYYAPTRRFGTPEDFMYFVDYCHKNGVGVILDWVPAHFPRDGHGLFDFDGKQIYASESWRRAEQREWGTLVFDFGKKEVDNFLLSNALFWLDRYHVDGLRVDAVACMLYLDYARQPGEWEPNKYGGRENLEAIEFLKKFNRVVHGSFPGILTIAEESTTWPGVSQPVHLGGLGFSMKWNMGWMHDTLEYFSKDPLFRKYHQGMFPFSTGYAFSENFILPISHDEAVYGKRSLLEKMPGDDWQKFSNLRLFLAYMFAFPGKKLLLMGSDFAQRNEWNFNQSLDWHLMQAPRHRRVNRMLRDLHRLYKENPAFHEGDRSAQAFEWIDHSDGDRSVLSFVRWSSDHKQLLVFVFNMTPMILENYRVGVPYAGHYQEIFNNQAFEYGGCGLGNLGGLHSETVAWQHRPFSLSVHLPPLGALIFRLS
jgi:1,4-alpha-glucan branching enzyme